MELLCVTIGGVAIFFAGLLLLVCWERNQWKRSAEHHAALANTWRRISDDWMQEAKGWETQLRTANRQLDEMLGQTRKD